MSEGYSICCRRNKRKKTNELQVKQRRSDKCYLYSYRKGMYLVAQEANGQRERRKQETERKDKFNDGNAN